MSNFPLILRAPLHPREDTSWEFTFQPPKASLRTKKGIIRGKHITFTADSLVLNYDQFPTNRILHQDDPAEFILASFGDFRFPHPEPGYVTADYMKRFFAAGLVLNDKKYRFYGHSNSQLRSRSCFLRAAATDLELDERIYSLGDFEKIRNIAKRAKRIGLLFSGAEIDYQLDPKYTKDIPDIREGDELFSDGCGLISRHLAQQVSAQKKIMFRGQRYTPCVFQIRYRSYKGVLMLHPQLDQQRQEMVQFRRSMKKFETTIDTTLSIVDYSVPYSFGRLNSDIIVLLSALGVTNERLLSKQDAYFRWLMEATDQPNAAINLLSAMGRYELVEKVLLHGLDDVEVRKAVEACQNKEVAAFKKNDKERARMLIPKSRLLFGVCDPFGVLKPGEVHVRILDRTGATTLQAIDVMVIRNPCLHPGDLLKLRAAYHPALSHLVDCVVFASKGRRAAPSMSSGGDLDGDKYLVCWDEDIVPPRIAESYTYPPNKERIASGVTRADMANYFASYNSAGLAKVSALHRKWAILSGAMSAECQELNALHSQSVDGARVKIPDRLLNPPAPAEPYILDLLARDARAFAEKFSQRPRHNNQSLRPALTLESFQESHELLMRLITSEDPSLAFTEMELVEIILRTCRKMKDGMHYLERYLNGVNFGALPSQYKHALSNTLHMLKFAPNNPLIMSRLWNSLLDSDILQPSDLVHRKLDQPLRLQRLYSSSVQGRAQFFEYLKLASQDYTRKVIVLKTDGRFSIGIFVRGRFEWDADPVVDDNVAVCSFQATSTNSNNSTYKTMHKGYVLHCSENIFQLYERQRGNTFIFITRPPIASGQDLAVSIALQKFDTRVQRQIGRINRTPVKAIEIHVVSHRDREAHQLFDLRFSHVETEEVLPRFPRQRILYQKNTLKSVDWESTEPAIRLAFMKPITALESTLSEYLDETLQEVMDFSINHHADEHTFAIYQTMLSRDAMELSWSNWLDRVPVLVYPLLRKVLPDDSTLLPETTLSKIEPICRSIVLSANLVGIASLVALEKLAESICYLSLEAYFDLLWLTALSVRSFELCREMLVVLSDSRKPVWATSPSLAYAHKFGVGVACDRAEEAADECPCDDFGNPRKQSKPPMSVRVYLVDDQPLAVKVHIRVDRESSFARLGSHVRLRAASAAENDNQALERVILDGVVTQSGKGEVYVKLFTHPPPETNEMGWLMYLAGSVTTSRAMMDAVLKLATDGWEACQLHSIITGEGGIGRPTAIEPEETNPELDEYNDSQRSAVLSVSKPLSLVWGPPGTGKTTVVVAMLCKMVRNLEEGEKVLVTASTHNAVDNVLERFAKKNVLDSRKIIRVATDFSKVNKDLQKFTIDAALGGSPTDNPALIKKAEQRVRDAVVVFTTCTGAGLGVLRKFEFANVIIDEASQVTEPCALIPLVKGCKRAILVGDHVQLRPTVRPLGEAFEFDVSLLERLYTSPETPPGLVRTMLDVQYRSPEVLVRFPSQQFYEGKLKTGTRYDPNHEALLRASSFPWPTDEATSRIIPSVFVECKALEDYGRSSKGNLGQVELVSHIVKLLTTDPNPQGSESQPVVISVISPYARQVKELKGRLPSTVTVSTVDGFQGREADIIIFTTVRSNIEGELGFVDNGRRLNVALTRAKWARIVVGNKMTLGKKSELWRKAIEDVHEMVIDVPDADP